MDVVTGSFGYIGKYITRHLLSLGKQANTITTHPEKSNPFGEGVRAYPFDFDDPRSLTDHLQGCDRLYNTYWVRFDWGSSSFETALANTNVLFRCAKAAHVHKVVHISVTNASEQSALPYYHGKGVQERMLRESGLPHAIVRPTLVFGTEDILVNNMVWMMRRFSVFPVFGSGEYRVQPVFVEDLARIAVDCAEGSDSELVDAIGPETFTFAQFVRLLASHVPHKVWLVRTHPRIGIFLGRMLGLLVRDVVLTGDELRGLMSEALCSIQGPKGETAFSAWYADHANAIGNEYRSELARHYQWRPIA